MITRRAFLASTGSALMALPTFSARAQTGKIRVGVMGHTGRGNYGHGLDTVWQALPECQIAGVSDPDADGLAKARERLGTDHAFPDYREMLRQVRPEFVSVCPRNADLHKDMALAALEAGVKGLYVEKPFCRNPAEADELVEACRKHGAKLAVAHRNRWHPVLQTIDKLMVEGRIGKVLEIRGRGKGDRRGGAEDLWVLGSHVLNLVHYFGGKPVSCSARLKQDGHLVTKADVKEGPEGLGPLAGDELHARYEMSRGLVAYFDSLAHDQTRNAGFGLQIIGSEGIIAIQCDRWPLAHLIPGNPFLPAPDSPRPWIPISSAGPGLPEPMEDLRNRIEHHLDPVRDLIAAVREEREPLCGVQDGATNVEMICAVFESHRQGGKAVGFPLKERRNALGLL